MRIICASPSSNVRNEEYHAEIPDEFERDAFEVEALAALLFENFGGAFFFVFVFVVGLGEGVVFGLGGVIVADGVLVVVILLVERANFLGRVGVCRCREHFC